MTERKKAKDLVWTSTAYFGEGLPWSFLHQLVTEYLQAIGAPREQVGYTSWFNLPVTLKPLFSPMVDLIGTRRTWMVSLQILIGVVMGLVALLVGSGAGSSDQAPIWIVLVVLAFMHATHDIACDGLYMSALDAPGRALYSGTRLAAFRIAMYVGGSLLVVLAARAGWTLAFSIAAVLMAVIGAVNVAVVPRVDEPHPTASAPRAPVWSSYASFLRQPQILRVLAFVMTYQLSDALTFAMSSPFLDSLGIGLEPRGWIRGLSLTATIGGAILAGWVIARGGLERWLVRFTYLMAIPFYLVIALTHPPIWVVAVLVAIEQFTGNLASTALTVFLMRRCRRAFSASHYAFFTALTALGRTFAGGLSGHLSTSVGHEAYFAICFAAAVPALVLVHFVPKLALELDETPTAV